MSTATIELIAAFERLPVSDREEFLGELARRLAFGDGAVDLRTRGIGETQAADLRARLRTFAEDWDCAEMAIYDEDQTR
jgi:hypothetical protein